MSDGSFTKTPRLIAEIESLRSELADLRKDRERLERLRAAAGNVLAGFNIGVFVRGTARDAESGWALRILPYIVALANLDKETGSDAVKAALEAK